MPFVVFFVVLAANVQLLPAPRDASLQNLRVMTWNVHMGYDDQGRFNPEEIVDVIAEQQPDVLVLNEVDRGWLLSGGHDLLTILADELQLEHTFGAAADAIWGNAILSRHPILDPTVSLLPGDAPMDRGLITAKIDIGGAPLGIIATHFHHLHDSEEDDAIRRLQAEMIAESALSLEQRSIPVVILGDLNATPGSRALEPLVRYSDLVAEASSGAFLPTFPAVAPVEQIDHILGSPGIGASNLDIPRTTASDHLPIAVTIDAS